MKKIISVFLVCFMFLTLTGCGASKEKYSPEEVKKKLEDSGYEISKEAGAYVNAMETVGYITGKTVIGFFDNDELGFVSYANKSINNGFFHLGVSQEANISTLSKLEKEYAKEQQDDFDKWQKELDISSEELIDFFNWYYKNN